MANNSRAIPRHAPGFSFDRLCRSNQSVMATVVDGEREVDAFRASTPWLLRASLRPIFRHLRLECQEVRFSGVEERWLPGGFRRTRREIQLPSLNAALAFLTVPSSR